MADLQKLVDELSGPDRSGGCRALQAAGGQVGRLRCRACRGGCCRRRRRRAAAAPAEEQTEFTVILAKAGDKKINVIKEIRTITGPGPEGSQGPGRGRAEDREGRREQGRGREAQEAARGSGRRCRGQVRHVAIDRIRGRRHRRAASDLDLDAGGNRAGSRPRYLLLRRGRVDCCELAARTGAGPRPSGTDEAGVGQS